MMELKYEVFNSAEEIVLWVNKQVDDPGMFRSSLVSIQALPTGHHIVWYWSE